MMPLNVSNKWTPWLTTDFFVDFPGKVEGFLDSRASTWGGALKNRSEFQALKECVVNFIWSKHQKLNPTDAAPVSPGLNLVVWFWGLELDCLFLMLWLITHWLRFCLLEPSIDSKTSERNIWIHILEVINGWFVGLITLNLKCDPFPFIWGPVINSWGMWFLRLLPRLVSSTLKVLRPLHRLLPRPRAMAKPSQRVAHELRALVWARKNSDYMWLH
jgi:hypothetical protein